jgi:hypothetical protein
VERCARRRRNCAEHIQTSLKIIFIFFIFGRSGVWKPRYIVAHDAGRHLELNGVLMPFSVTEVQPTPNPNAAKFMLDRPVADQPISFFNAGAAQSHPLAARLFAISGVSSLLLLGDFITVNKSPNANWNDITPQVERVLSEA